MLKHTLAALVLASSFAVAGSACTDRQPPVVHIHPQAPDPRPSQMTVNGQATLEVSPDCADVTITMSVENGRTSVAMKDVEAKKLALVASLHKLGIETSQVKLSSLNLEPVYAVDARGYPTSFVRTYRARITVTATTKDFAKIGDIMDAAATAGSTSMSTEFRRSDLPELKKKVRDMALIVAKQKAEQTANTLGIKLGRITAVAETPAGHMWGNQYFPSNASAIVSHDHAQALGGQLQPLTLDVSISYELATQT